jgi:pimeloyl-ACP methyl ester carboxylesterase
MKRLLLALPLIGLALAGTELELTTPTGVLHGTLESPATPDKSVCVLILPGSGPTDRDGNSLGLPGKNDSLKKVAEDLAHRDISSVRIDKRGIGASKAAGPKEENLRFDTYVEDAVAWIEFLQGPQGFKNVIILGHSEGALIGVVAAVKKPVAGYISLAGTSRRASVLLREQLATKLTPELITESNIILQQLDQGTQVKKVSSALDPLFRKSVQPYLISWFKYSPTEEIAKLTCPGLIVQGTTDIQIAFTDAEALHAARSGSKLVKIEGMNHVLKKVASDQTAQISSYSDPSLPLHPGLMAPISQFIRESSGTRVP